MINQKDWFNNLHLSIPPKDIMFGIIKRNKLIGVTGLTYIDWKNKHAEISIYLTLKNWQKTKEVKETIEAAKDVDEQVNDMNEPFTIGEAVSHGVYGEGKVLNMNKAGKHWSIEV